MRNAGLPVNSHTVFSFLIQSQILNLENSFAHSELYPPNINCLVKTVQMIWPQASPVRQSFIEILFSGNSSLCQEDSWGCIPTLPAMFLLAQFPLTSAQKWSSPSNLLWHPGRSKENPCQLLSIPLYFPLGKHSKLQLQNCFKFVVFCLPGVS